MATSEAYRDLLYDLLGEKDTYVLAVMFVLPSHPGALLRVTGWPKTSIHQHHVEAGAAAPCRGAGVDDGGSGWAVQMCLWSLNPAVAFRSVSESARSVILASGTLSPLGSFASEVRCRLMMMWC